MHIVLVLSLLLSFSIKLLGQKTSVGVNIQPCLTYYTIQSDFTGAAQEFRLLNKPIVSFQGGIVMTKAISPVTQFLVGMMYAERGLRSQFNTNNVYAVNFSNSGYDVKVVDRNIELPLSIIYHFKKYNSHTWFAAVGLKPSLYLNSISSGGGVTSSYYYNGHRRVHLFITLGVGASININKKWKAIIWPQLEHSIVNETYAQPLKLYPYSIGLNLCLLYSLGN